MPENGFSCPGAPIASETPELSATSGPLAAKARTRGFGGAVAFERLAVMRLVGGGHGIVVMFGQLIEPVGIHRLFQRVHDRDLPRMVGFHQFPHVLDRAGVIRLGIVGPDMRVADHDQRVRGACGRAGRCRPAPTSTRALGDQVRHDHRHIRGERDRAGDGPA